MHEKDLKWPRWADAADDSDGEDNEGNEGNGSDRGGWSQVLVANQAAFLRGERAVAGRGAEERLKHDVLIVPPVAGEAQPKARGGAS